MATSTNPTSGGSWQAATLTSNVSINAVACPSVAFCVLGGDSNGLIETSTNPSGGAAAWASPQTIAHGDAIESLACPSARLASPSPGTAR